MEYLASLPIWGWLALALIILAATALLGSVYSKRVLLWLDQGLNVVFVHGLNGILYFEAWARAIHITEYHRFGFPDETLSSVFGKNQEFSYFCKAWSAFLEWIDPGHMERAIEPEEGRRFRIKKKKG